MKKIIYILFGLFAFVACDTEDDLIEERIANAPFPDPPTGDPGSLNLSKYVAIGTNGTAGFMGGALYTEGQSKSFPAILAGQLSIASGVTDFNQPDINSLNGFLIGFPNPDPATGAILGKLFLDVSIPGPSPTLGELIGAFTGDKTALNNFGVPATLLGQLLIAQTGGPNDPANPAFSPFYARFGSNPGTSTVIGDALAALPTFFTFEAGINDVLLYAVGGATGAPAPLTDAGTFDATYNAAIATLMGNSAANGVLLDIPAITAFPFFQAIPYNAVPLDDATAATLNAAYAGYNAALDGAAAVGDPNFTQTDADARKITFAAGPNAVIIEDEDAFDVGGLWDILVVAAQMTPEQRAALVPLEQVRQTTATDLLPLATGTVLVTGGGTAFPLTDQYVLTPEEQLEINTALVAFNTTIATAAATEPRLALMSFNDPGGFFFDIIGLSDGVVNIEVEGQTLTPDFAPSGIYSADGLNFNPRGNALIVNEILKSMETAFGSDIPEVSVLKFRGVLFQ